MHATRTTPVSSRQAGSSLVEVLVASAILGMGLLGLILGQTRAGNDLRQMQWHTDARVLAMALAEQVRAYGPSGLPAVHRAAWRDRVAERLPEGEASVEWPRTRAGRGVITLAWRRPGQAEAAQLRYVFRP
ncbi:hypothetical protein SPICUR_06980 [Spiribacter curvatus]|uniref:Type IV pilus modification protein PilV n=1 Tax=Spiribacter curvatus TaxID=1335757 RepID=U5T4H9_9GAMM|nr:prepilin-type N-terminal cleavage/methylation domain-containing protein [Spiribacter curvatus]AGY92360.1 hypothetical protein SPICUR_06980 [Spiribacter curvatus]